MYVQMFYDIYIYRMYEKYQSKQYCAMSENQLRGSAKGNCSSFRVLDPYIFLLAMKKTFLLHKNSNNVIIRSIWSRSLQYYY